MSFVDTYLDPISGVLKNRFDITDQVTLDRVEREWVVQRIMEGCPSGDFDLDHLRTIHRHLFQDIFDWAGEIRTVELSKNGDDFQPTGFIGTGMANVHMRVRQQDYLRKLSATEFAEAAARIIGDVNYVHPFREGNGRTQLQYLQQLAAQAGHPLDITTFRDEWITASRASHQGDYSLMATSIAAAIVARRRA